MISVLMATNFQAELLKLGLHTSDSLIHTSAGSDTVGQAGHLHATPRLPSNRSFLGQLHQYVSDPNNKHGIEKTAPNDPHAPALTENVSQPFSLLYFFFGKPAVNLLTLKLYTWF